MKTIKCYQCKESWKPRKVDRERCPRCHSEFWMTPTLADRFYEAWMAFIHPW